jgi:hypothetical protein
VVDFSVLDTKLSGSIKAENFSRVNTLFSPRKPLLLATAAHYTYSRYENGVIAVLLLARPSIHF